MDIELRIYYNIVTIWFLFIIQSINLPPSAHTTAAITYSVHTATLPYLHVQPCTTICSQFSVHTAANCSHLQPPTLQLYHSVHTAATLSDANTIQCI